MAANGNANGTINGGIYHDETFLFTSESVSEGHPDKMCDQVSALTSWICLTQRCLPSVALSRVHGTLLGGQ